MDTSVTIHGKGFTGATAVQFNGIPATTFEVLGSNRIRATVPAGACPSTGPISVSTPSGTVVSENDFTCAATLSNFSPKKGVVDTIVTIHGKGFTGTTAVQFNGSPATFEVLGSNRIRATVPAGACPETGPISVNTPSGPVVSEDDFTCAATLSNFSPKKGVVDTIVTIQGKGFTGTTAVQFNGSPATTFEVLGSNRIQATVPAGATTGPISVNTPSGPATSEKRLYSTANNNNNDDNVTTNDNDNNQHNHNNTANNNVDNDYDHNQHNHDNTANNNVRQRQRQQPQQHGQRLRPQPAQLRQHGQRLRPQPAQPQQHDQQPQPQQHNHDNTHNNNDNDNDNNHNNTANDHDHDQHNHNNTTNDYDHDSNNHNNDDQQLQRQQPAQPQQHGQQPRQPQRSQPQQHGQQLQRPQRQHQQLRQLQRQRLRQHGQQPQQLQRHTTTTTRPTTTTTTTSTTTTTRPTTTTTTTSTTTTTRPRPRQRQHQQPRQHGQQPRQRQQQPRPLDDNDNVHDHNNTANDHNHNHHNHDNTTNDYDHNQHNHNNTANDHTPQPPQPQQHGQQPRQLQRQRLQQHGQQPTTTTTTNDTTTTTTTTTQPRQHGQQLRQLQRQRLQQHSQRQQQQQQQRPQLQRPQPAQPQHNDSTTNNARQRQRQQPTTTTTRPTTTTTRPTTTTTTSTTTTTTLPSLSINNFSPNKGIVDTSVTIHGKGFTGATAVQFNGTPATTFEVLGSNRIRATVPAGACPETGPISVSTPSGTVVSEDDFTCAATLSNFSPKKGVVDTIVTIQGKGFTGTTAVQFNGSPATTFEVLGSNRIRATVPAGACPETGPISVSTPSGTVVSEDDFTCAATLSNFSPKKGVVDTIVTIQGKGFTGTTAVQFNGSPATFEVLSSNRIQATVPAGATTGPISVNTPSGPATSDKDFTIQ